MCRNPSTADRDRKQPYRTDCSVISTKGIGKGDLVVVVGTGTPGCAYVPELRYLPQCSFTPGQKESFLSLHALDQLWDKRNTLKVHFPVRNLVALSQQENIFGFDHIVPDNSFFKPMGEKGGLLAELSRCYRNDKLPDLLYVARYEEYKGQLKFVQQADPALLHGFTVHFYGGGGEAEYMQRVTEAAAARGIQVKLHTRVSKRDLMSHSCKAAGQIMWSKFDNNPRAAYEGLYVGMPLFISTTAGVPAQLLEQRFVTPVDWNSDVAHFNTQLAGYMRYVKGSLSSRRMRRAVVEYTKTALNPDNVYWEICERVGVCAHRDVIQGVVDGDDGFDGTESSFLNGTARARGPAQPAGVHNMRPFQRAWGATMGETAGEM
jgi:glycosyltransferase involved in cell wall biosynthesis